jgi:hypothetical protein
MRLSNVNTGMAALISGAVPTHTKSGAGGIRDDDIVKLDRLQLINASARFELLSAN